VRASHPHAIPAPRGTDRSHTRSASFGRTPKPGAGKPDRRNRTRRPASNEDATADHGEAATRREAPAPGMWGWANARGRVGLGRFRPRRVELQTGRAACLFRESRFMPHRVATLPPSVTRWSRWNRKLTTFPALAIENPRGPGEAGDEAAARTLAAIGRSLKGARPPGATARVLRNTSVR
jgi:hypothetical protein